MNLLGNDYLVSLTDSVESWCEKYDISPAVTSCLGCGNQIKTTIPAFSKCWRGLVAPPCECGKTSNFKRVVLTGLPEESCLMSVLA